METFEIRYFLAAAASENLQKAAKVLAISPPAISRAIARLESELGVKLFHRVGRNIELSADGKRLQREAERVIGLLDDIRFQFRPSDRAVPVSLCGTEFGVSAFLPEVIRRFKAANIDFTLDVKVLHDVRLVERAILDGETQLGIVSGKPLSAALTSAPLGMLESRTLVGAGHPLYKAAKSRRKVRVEEVLEHEFVSFSQRIFGGSLAYAASGDGWRDDKFPRRIGLKTESVEVALRVIESGLYLGYLPTSLAEQSGVQELEVTGCPYSCKTESFLLARNPKDLSWMSRLF